MVKKLFIFFIVLAISLHGATLDMSTITAHDGVTDDSAAINLAVDAMSASGGGTAYFPSGTYSVASYVHIRSNVTYCGDGDSSVIIASPASVDNVMAVTGEAEYPYAVTSVSIHDLCLDGNSSLVSYRIPSNDAYQNLLRFFRTTNYSVYNVLFRNSVMNGFSDYFISSTGYVTHCRFYNIGKGAPYPSSYSFNAIFCEYQPSNVEFSGNIISGCMQDGIYINTSTTGWPVFDINVLNNSIRWCGGHGIWIKDIAGTSPGVFSGVIVSHNFVEKCSCATGAMEAAVRIESFSSGVQFDGLHVTDNVVSNNFYMGMLIGGNNAQCFGPVISLNTCNSNPDKSILISSACISAVLTGNVSQNNGNNYLDFGIGTTSIGNKF